jgi:hypothetical protein
MYALSPKPCLCSPRRSIFIMVDEMFFQHAWRQQSFTHVIWSWHGCLSWSSSRRREFFFLQTCCFYLLNSFCALCIESSRHLCASLQCVGQRSVASMVCIINFKPP